MKQMSLRLFMCDLLFIFFNCLWIFRSEERIIAQEQISILMQDFLFLGNSSRVIGSNRQTRKSIRREVTR